MVDQTSTHSEGVIVPVTAGHQLRGHLTNAERASTASEPRDRSAPTKRRARARVGESEGRSPSDETRRGVEHAVGKRLRCGCQ